MKIFSRIVLVNLAIGYFMAFFRPIVFSKSSIDMSLSEWLIFSWIVLSTLFGLFWWCFMFYHWGVSQFKSRAIKVCWFWALLLGTMLYLIGPILYYIIVFERGKGLKGT